MATIRFGLFKCTGVWVLGAALAVAGGNRAAAGEAMCCNPNVVPPFSPPDLHQPDFNDIAAVVNCYHGIGVIPSCDVNCDGTIDVQDIGDIVCMFRNLPQNQPACCSAPHGACCQSGVAAECLEYPNLGSDPLYNSMCANPGSYLGNGTRCDLGPCDCNSNGLDDACDVDCGPPGGVCDVPGCGGSVDCNKNRIPDECESPAPSTRGACCFSNQGVPACASNSTPASCSGLGGTWYSCKKCAAQSVGVVTEPGGSIFVHVVGPPVDCDVIPIMQELRSVAACAPGSRIDPWVSPASGQMCHVFGTAGSPAIPADFFGPGSDPFTGSVCLKGQSLNDPNFLLADTLISRSADPFDRCAAPSATPATVVIEIVALSLVSVSPITVTYNGGLNPQQWNAAVDLSTVGAPMGSLTATKSYCNGGTYTSVLPVQPRFTFTHVGGAEIAVLDAGLAGRDPVVLTQSDPLPWVSDVDPMLAVVSDSCTSFHPGIEDVIKNPTCDCNGNLLRDSCDIERRISADCNFNLTPDECDIASGRSADADHNGIPDECPALSPPIPDPSNFDKCRFISFSVPAVGGESALRVKLVSLHHVVPQYTGATSVPFTQFEGQFMYVGPPAQYVESVSSGTPFYASQLQCAPYYQDWSTIGLLHVTGEAITPSSGYQVEILAASCAGNEATCTTVSAGLPIKTTRWGDVETPYQDPLGPLVTQPDTSDISALVNKFKSALGAPIKARAMLSGSTTRGTITHDDIATDVGFTHISLCVDAFKGLPYPYKPGKCTGVSSVACFEDPDCAGDVCVGGTQNGQTCPPATCSGGVCTPKGQACILCP